MIQCENVGKRFGRRWIFRKVDLEVNQGECLVVLGANGSGKSTLLKMLAGLLPATEGKIVRGGDRRTALGFAALDQPVYPVLTVAEHLELAAELRGCEPKVAELLAEVELSHAAGAAGRHLSTGMRARLKFALAIQAEPAVVILDEPSAGLDERGRAVVTRLIETRRDRTAFILATNDPNERRFATHEIALG